MCSILQQDPALAHCNTGQLIMKQIQRTYMYCICIKLIYQLTWHELHRKSMEIH